MKHTIETQIKYWQSRLASAIEDKETAERKLRELEEKYKCPDCGGDGVETCHNPDHGFLRGVIGAVYSANESACPCCGHHPDFKMKGICETCKGTGRVDKDVWDKYADEYGYDNEPEPAGPEPEEKRLLEVFQKLSGIFISHLLNI